MVNIRRWISCMLLLVLLTQCIPLNVLAETMNMITEAEIQEALLLASLQPAAGWDDTDESSPLRLEMKESRYHKGMGIDETWDAPMMLDWLDSMLKTELYNVAQLFSQAETNLERMQTENPADYLRYTCGENEKFVKDCHQYAIDLELAEETTRFLRTRLQENITEIQLGVEMLVNSGENLFEHEKIRVSAQIRNAVRQLKSVMEDTILFGLEQIFVLMTGQAIVKGEIEPEFSAWLKELVNTTEEPVFKSVSLQDSNAFAGNTLLSRLSPVSSALASGGTNDVVISVLKKNQFAIVIHGADNKPLPGVSVTIKDLNNGTTKTVKTTDPELGIATFETSDFVCDYDQEMELSMTVDGSAVGYESFSIPWMLMKMGGKRTEVLTPLQSAQPEPVKTISFAAQTQQKSTSASAKTRYRPYVYSCTFNDMDIWRTNKKIRVSALNDTEFDFAIEVVNASGQEIRAPLLCYWTYTGKTFTGSLEKKVMSPTSSVKVDGIRTKYVYRNKWKQILAPDIKWNQNPYFVFPDTNKEVHTLASPVRSKVDQPNIADTGVNSPLRKVLGDGFGLGFTIPTIKANIGLNIPSAEYLPKVVIDGYDYITVTMGSTLVEPKKMNWKNTEQERYDKGMKQYQHETSVAARKQMIGMASKYYKYMGADHQSMKKLSTKIGFFFMLSGRFELSDPDDGSTYWNAGGTAGLTVVISFDYTWPFAIGPFPFYANLNFSAAAGFGGGIAVRVWMAKDGSYRNFDFDLAGITIAIRLALTISLGAGVKGIASLWVSATGALNIMLQFVKKQPIHIAVFLEVNVAVGFEFFFITYSQIIWSANNIEIYKNYKETGGHSFFKLLTAYAAEKEKSVHSVEMTPEKYSQLAPVAKKVITNSESTLSGIKVVEAGKETYAFMIGPYTDENGKTTQRVTYVNLKNGKREVLKYGNSPVNTDGNDYAFDVFSDGQKIALLACFARTMEEDGTPMPNMPREIVDGGGINYSEGEVDASNLMYAAILSPDPDSGALKGTKSDNYAIFRSRTGYNVATNPKIEAMTGATENLTITGSVDARNSVSGVKGFVSFRTNSSAGNPLSTVDLESDQSVMRAQGDRYEIVEMRSDPFGKAAIEYGHQYGDRLVRSNGFIALTRPKNQAAGDHVIELFDYDMNFAGVQFRGLTENGPYTTTYTDPSYVERVIVQTQRKAVPLDSGDIDKIEVVNSQGARTIFYTKTVKAGDREEKRLKSIYISSKKGAGTENISFDLTYTDYDLSIESGDFKAVTLGTSQYLYWLTTAPREKKSDPVTWRITGVYYDSSTGSVSDEIVIAEFALPESPYNGKNYPSVPYDIILTESGTGYITAKPNAGKEKMNGTLPLTLYSFPISLKPVGVLKDAAVMDNVVTQGDFVAADIAMMNEGNMGIGSFILEVVLLENGKEKSVVETMYANCLDPQNSRIVMSDGTTVLKGEKVLYRYKDFIYSPKQREWIVNTQNSNLSVARGVTVSQTKGTESKKRVATNVLVPGALGGFSGNIKIPSDWAGKYKLRLRVKEVSTYPNWIAASALAEKHPELFALVDSGDLAGMRKKAKVLMEAVRNPLERQAVQSLTYRLDASGRQMVLTQTPLLMGALAAGGSGFPGIPGLPVQLFAAGAAEGMEEESVLLYPTSIEAPAAVDLDVNVHDINVSHRVYRDYYGELMLEIIIGNYLNNEQSIRLRCMVYEDDAVTGRMFYLPTDADVVSVHTTQTITMPLSRLVDPLTHEKVRVVITGISIDDSIATFNNEFTIYLGGTIPEPVPALPDTGDNGHLLLWAGLFVAGLGAVILTGIVRSRKRRK